jgi:hypothetical protein
VLKTAACWMLQALSCCWWALRMTPSAQVREARLVCAGCPAMTAACMHLRLLS